MKKIKLTGKNGDGKYAFVDNEFFNSFSQYKWYIVSGGYVARSEWNKESKKLKTIYMHRQVAKTPHNKQTDHINLNKLDNRKVNLRNCSRKQNLGNTPIAKHNKSGFKGVSVRNNKWRAYISHYDKHVHLGYFNTKELAAEAYNKKALELFGKFALLNKV